MPRLVGSPTVVSDGGGSTVPNDRLVPTNGLLGQVLTMGSSDREWADLPGFAPTNKTASGTTDLRTAPGASTTLITELAADSLVQDTGGRVTETSVDYARVIGPDNVGSGWIPESQLTELLRCGKR